MENVKFKSECQTNVFITGKTSFIDLQVNIIRKLGLDAKKRVKNIYYRVPIAQYLEVRTTELYVEIDDVGVSSGGSIPPPPLAHVRPTHALGPVLVPETERVVSPSFDVNLPQDDEDACDLGDNRSLI
ncbi:hypothetical protein PIB30_051685 [Stylosanthes scabra]|uniref:Uncharacterized protein n=1 Tax=Stylosanthes scabra TaxID=79078 RepID=A0ABU6VHH3_9FABA|nr:hypothetical protein [Stylosanthes scabra]